MLRTRLAKVKEVGVFLFYTPGWGGCWAVEGFPRGRRTLFCSQPNI